MFMSLLPNSQLRFVQMVRCYCLGLKKIRLLVPLLQNKSFGEQILGNEVTKLSGVTNLNAMALSPHQ